MIDDEMSIAKDIYIHHFDDNVDYPDVLKAIIVGIQKGTELKEKQIEELEEENEANKNGAEKYAEFYFETNDKLKQAKEIIYRLMDIINHDLKCFDTMAGYDIKHRAMEFLKEV